MWDVSDVKDDVVEHVKVISTTMKKTVSGQLRSRADDTEGTPLLQVASEDHHVIGYTSSIQVLYKIFNVCEYYRISLMKGACNYKYNTKVVCKVCLKGYKSLKT
jgi:hypothetical protein